MTDLRTETARLLALREGTTPGPWMAESGHEQSNGQLYWQVTDGSDAIMQNQFCWCKGDHAANARLIAAAPDMLDAIAALQAEVVALTARAEAAEAKVAELTADLNALRVEAEKAFGADDAIADAWDAIGTRGNPQVLSLAEQVSSIIRELDAALAEIGGGNG